MKKPGGLPLVGIEMGKIVAKVSKVPVWHVPKAKVRGLEGHLQDSDVVEITTTWKCGYTSHVGLIVKLKGRACLTHATSDQDK